MLGRQATGKPFLYELSGVTQSGLDFSEDNCGPFACVVNNLLSVMQSHILGDFKHSQSTRERLNTPTLFV